MTPLILPSIVLSILVLDKWFTKGYLDRRRYSCVIGKGFGNRCQYCCQPWRNSEYEYNEPNIKMYGFLRI